MKIKHIFTFCFVICICCGILSEANAKEIKQTKDTWLFGNEKKGKDIVNSSNKTVPEIGNISYKEINSNPDRFVIGFDTDEFVTPYKKFFNKIILKKDQNGVDLILSLKGAQFVAKDPAWATSGKAVMYLGTSSFKISFSKPVSTAGVMLSSIKDQDWLVCFYNGKELLKEEKVGKTKSKSVFIAYKSDNPNITHVWLKRTNKESKKAGYVDDIAIIL